MQKTDFHDAVEQVLTNDSSYSSDSYYSLKYVDLLHCTSSAKDMYLDKNGSFLPALVDHVL